jgi:hypothetical protein
VDPPVSVSWPLEGSCIWPMWAIQEVLLSNRYRVFLMTRHPSVLRQP